MVEDFEIIYLPNLINHKIIIDQLQKDQCSLLRISYYTDANPTPCLHYINYYYVRS